MVRAPEAERQAAFEVCAAYWERGSREHRMKPGGVAECGCPADYLTAHAVWSNPGSGHDDCTGSGYYHLQSDGLWWAIFDDD